jgi:hypothetical protein
MLVILSKTTATGTQAGDCQPRAPRSTSTDRVMVFSWRCSFGCTDGQSRSAADMLASLLLCPSAFVFSDGVSVSVVVSFVTVRDGPPTSEGASDLRYGAVWSVVNDGPDSL